MITEDMKYYHLLHADNTAIRENTGGNFIPICDLGKIGGWKAHKGHLLEAFKRGHFEYATSMWAADIEDVFTSTQNHQEPWSPKRPMRSTSVGDLILCKDEGKTRLWIVSKIGFEEVEAYEGCNPNILINRAYALVNVGSQVEDKLFASREEA
jgi:hypothetical protein